MIGPASASSLFRIAFAGGLLLSFLFAPRAFAADVTFDLLFDLDRTASSGCSVASADGNLPGVELRLRTTVDLVTEEVTAVTHASCVAPSTNTFGSATPVSGVGVPPWTVVVGNGTSGSTLIETYFPLSLVAAPTMANVYATTSAAAGSDALSAPDGSMPGGGIPIQLGNVFVPSLSLYGSAVLVGVLLVTAFLVMPRDRPANVLPMLLVFFAVATPIAVRAGLGDGTLLIWAPEEEKAIDPVGDAPEGVDILKLFARFDAAQDTVFVRLDVFLGPAVCLDWGTVDPGTGYSCDQEPPPDQGPFGLQVAMTFDDGPNLATTPSILTILRNENIPATFFMLGKKLETADEQALALEIHNDPLFQIANHSYSHSDFMLLSVAEIEDELDSTSDLIRSAIGDDCYFAKYFRFPRGRSDCSSMEAVRGRGFGVAGVNVDPVDWCYASGGGCCPPSKAPWVPSVYECDLPGYAVHRLISSTGGIMLMHDIHPNTVAELPNVISAMQAAGASFIRLDNSTELPIINMNVNPPEPPACCDGVVN